MLKLAQRVRTLSHPQLSLNPAEAHAWRLKRKQSKKIISLSMGLIMRPTRFPRASIPVRPTTLRPIANTHTALSHTACLSTSRDDSSGRAQPSEPGSGAPQPQNPSYPAFSFQGLGADRKVKVFVITFLAVVGTVESVFWIKVARAKFSPSPAEARNKPDES